VVWCGVVWCGVVWCGVVWCGVVWCGVVVVEREKAASLLAAAAKKVADETKRLTEIRGGGPLRPAWLEGALRKGGVLAEGESL
jgi:4-hydroxy-4-methyl-2-oxoglutarate aldolase